ncbi:MAG: two-component system, LytT family, response regulator [Bacteroidetes bacterium]|nr:MAG: two-component system, LytT family, response regulator [Bacteroidota bacterium]
MKKAIIIDDEPRSAEQLQHVLAEAAPGIEVAGIAHDALTGLAMLRDHEPDLLFLDVEMPGPSGFDLLEHVDVHRLKIIFVTAHADYSIRAIRAGADDYLLKPVSAADLEACLGHLARSEAAAPQKLQANDILRFPVKDGFIFIRRAELVRVEGAGSYVYLHLLKGVRHMISRNIGQMEKLLADDPRFFRCHNSHIVNLDYVERFISTEGNFLQLRDGSQAEVARKTKEELFRLLENR